VHAVIDLLTFNFTVYNIYCISLILQLNHLLLRLLLSFQYFLSAVTSLPHEVLMTGDFSIHFDEIGDSHTQQFMILDNMAIVKHHLSVLTRYHHCHSLDVVITVADSPPCPVRLLSLTAYCHHLIIVIFYLYSTCFFIRWSDIMHYAITFYKIY
jgi:hypothetical protein